MKRTIMRASREVAVQTKEAFVTGLHVAAGVGALLIQVLGIIAWLWLPRRLPE